MSLSPYHMPDSPIQDIEGGFATIMLVRLGPSTGWNGHYLQVDTLRTYRFGRDPWSGQVPLLAFEFRTGGYDPTGRLATISLRNFQLHNLCSAFSNREHDGPCAIIGERAGEMHAWQDRSVSNTKIVHSIVPGHY